MIATRQQLSAGAGKPRLIPAGPTVVPNKDAVRRGIEDARQAVFEKLDRPTIESLLDTVIEKARGGDLAAIKLALGLLRPEASPVVAVQQHVQVGHPEPVVLHRLAALFIHKNGPTLPTSLGLQLGISSDDVGPLLEESEFFTHVGSAGWALTPEGRRAVG